MFRLGTIVKYEMTDTLNVWYMEHRCLKIYERDM